MIVIPAAVGFLIQQAAQAAAIGAVIGGLIGGGAEAVSSIREHGELNHEVAANVIHGAGKGATGGALGGAGVAAVGVVLAPVIPAAGILTGVQAPAAAVADDVAVQAINVLDDGAKSAVGLIDDAAKSIGNAVDDAAKPIAYAVDDATSPVISRVKNAAKSAAKGVSSTFNRARNTLNARFYTRLSKGNGNNGYVYVMDDVTTPGRYKFGKTIQPEPRLKQVQHDLNKTVGGKVEYTCIISTDNMSSLETSLKNLFKSQNIVGHPAGTEWFMLSAAQVAAACSH